MENTNNIEYNWDGEEELVGTIDRIIGRERNGMRRLMFSDKRAHFINNPIGLQYIVKLAKVNSLEDLIGITIKFNTGKYGIIDYNSIEIVKL